MAGAMRVDRSVECAASKERLLHFMGCGHGSGSAALEDSLEAAVAQCRLMARPAWQYALFDCVTMPPAKAQGEQGRLVLLGAALEVPLSQLSAPWANACKVALMACTLGMDLDRRLAALSTTDPMTAFLWDVAGGALVESCVDHCEQAVAEEAASQGLHCGQRVSPGYGALEPQLSCEVVSVLGADRILGVYPQPSGALVPSKSVTALVGLFDSLACAQACRYSCEGCSARCGCAFRRNGTTCFDVDGVSAADAAPSAFQGKRKR